MDPSAPDAGRNGSRAVRPFRRDAPMQANASDTDAPLAHMDVPGWVRGFGRFFFGLQSKATILVVALMLIVAAPLCGLAVRQAWNLASRLDRERAVQQARTIATLSAELMARRRTDELRRLARSVVTGDPLCFVRITDVSGAVVASADTSVGMPEKHGRSPYDATTLMGVPASRTDPKTGTRFWEVVYPINSQTGGAEGQDGGSMELLGHVRLGLVREAAISEYEAASDLLVGIAIAVVLATIPLAFFVVRRIVVPLEEMSSVARRFSAGDINARCSVKRTDEIGELGATLNTMAEQVARKHTEIVNLNAELEHRVLERTSQLRELASREPLTGLYNRRHMSEVLARRFSEARRYGGELSLMMIDMDNFKAVNDEFGHQAGDELLIQTALTISRQLRSADVAARFGGDEFIVLLPHSGSGEAQVLGDRLAQRFRSDMRRKLPHIGVSLSIGVAGLTESGAETVDEFIRAADRALYEAKALGKDRVVLAGAAEQ